MDHIRAKLDLIRRYTGRKFSAANGYDARKPLSKKRLKTIDRYFNLVNDLTARSHKIYRPKKGEKNEAFEFTGQKGYSYFSHAIVHSPDPAAKYTFKIDKARPKGSRFVVINKTSGERSYHIPAEPFWMIQDEDENGEPDYLSSEFEDILQEYAEGAELFMINAGDYHMWGSAGGARRVAEKLADLMKQYGSDNFDEYDRHSHHIDNWFKGVTAYSYIEEAWPYITERSRAQVKRNEERGNDGRLKARILRNGNFGAFIDGKLAYEVSTATATPVTPKGKKRASRRAKIRRK